jgi:hypothetical protein
MEHRFCSARSKPDYFLDRFIPGDETSEFGSKSAIAAVK